MKWYEGEAYPKAIRTKIVSTRAMRASMTPTRETTLRARLGLSLTRGSGGIRDAWSMGRQEEHVNLQAHVLIKGHTSAINL